MRDRSAPLTASEVGELAWDKMGGLIPALVQDRVSGDRRVTSDLEITVPRAFALEAHARSGDVDVTDLKSLSKAVDLHKPDWIVNCAAYSNVDRAESEPDRAGAELRLLSLAD